MSQIINFESLHSLNLVTLPSAFRALLKRYGQENEIDINVLAKTTISRSLEPAVSELWDKLPHRELGSVEPDEAEEVLLADQDLDQLISRLEAMEGGHRSIVEFAVMLSEALFIRGGLTNEHMSSELHEFLKLIGHEILTLRKLSNTDLNREGDEVLNLLDSLSDKITEYINNNPLSTVDREVLAEQRQHIERAYRLEFWSQFKNGNDSLKAA
jgi:hypothetical protein